MHTHTTHTHHTHTHHTHTHHTHTHTPHTHTPQNSSSALTSSSEIEKLADGVKTEELTNTTTERLRKMGERVLEHVCQHHQSLISEQHLSFLTARLPPFARDHGPEGMLCVGENDFV